MTTLAVFHTLVSAEVNRGTDHDTAIISYTRRAARWIERNYSFSYMDNFATGSLATTRTLSLPARLKKIDMFRIVDSDNEYSNLELIDPYQLDSTESGEPTAYWYNADTTIYLDKTPEETYSYEMQRVQYTSWPTDTSQSPWLCENAEDALLAQTIVMMKALLKLDDKLVRDWEKLRDEGLRTLFLADQEMRQANRIEFIRYG